MNIFENYTYINYNEKIQIDSEIIIISLWNRLLEMKGKGGRIFRNNREYFFREFADTYDAVRAVSASAGNYRWTDEFVYIDENKGCLMSFSLLDDVSCPINLDEIAIGNLIQELTDLENKNLQKK